MNAIEPQEYSRYARLVIGADPATSDELRLAATRAWTREEMRGFIEENRADDAAALGVVLRRLRRRVMLRTLARDLAGKAPLD